MPCHCQSLAKCKPYLFVISISASDFAISPIPLLLDLATHQRKSSALKCLNQSYCYMQSLPLHHILSHASPSQVQALFLHCFHQYYCHLQSLPFHCFLNSCSIPLIPQSVLLPCAISTPPPHLVSYQSLARCKLYLSVASTSTIATCNPYPFNVLCPSHMPMYNHYPFCCLHQYYCHTQPLPPPTNLVPHTSPLPGASSISSQSPPQP